MVSLRKHLSKCLFPRFLKSIKGNAIDRKKDAAYRLVTPQKQLHFLVNIQAKPAALTHLDSPRFGPAAPKITQMSGPQTGELAYKPSAADKGFHQVYSQDIRQRVIAPVKSLDFLQRFLFGNDHPVTSCCITDLR